jgi:signal transduction histidine kinase
MAGGPITGQGRRVSLRGYLVAVGLLWTAALASSLAWNLHRTHRAFVDLAVVEARATFAKDLVYRRWNAGQGGVYVEVNDHTPPNPWLEGVPGRDVTTVDGRHLTLVNPAYMTRQVHELAAKEYGTTGHITSLKPLRPENGPDAWEAAALRRIEAGAAEVVEEADLAGDTSLRFMGRLVTEARCLKCHAQQGYRVGDVRGGIAVAVPLAPYLVAEGRQATALAGWHGALWLLGLAGLALGGRRLSERVAEREAALRALHEAEQQLAGSRRLEAIGQLAGGLAHDLNNALAPILSYATMALEDVPPDSETHEDLAQVVGAAQRARGLVRRLLAFAQRQPLEVVPLDLSEVVAHLAPLLRDVLGKRGALELDLARDLPPVEADRASLETVLVNLCSNARDVLPNGGLVRAATAAVELDEAAALALQLQAGRHVLLSLSDSGAGMPPEVLAHLFEPFFTTKGVGRGTGLGLASVHGAVKQHGGAVAVESAPGQGTTVRVYLPAGRRPTARPYAGPGPSASRAAPARSQAS